MWRRVVIGYLVGALSILAPQFVIAKQPPPNSVRNFVLGNPPVFRNNPQWSNEIVLENDRLTEELGIGYTYYADFSSKHLNVRDGFRVTVGQPETWNYTIWMVGSSTLLDIAMYDAFTIPSRLQARLPDVRVVNAGMSAARLANMRNRLFDLPIQSGDRVIFYAGVMDSLEYGLAGWEDDVTRAIREAREYTEGKGASFLHVLEPNAVIGSTLYEAAVIDWFNDGGAVLTAKFHHAYDDLRRIDPQAVDLTGCLDDYRAAGNVVFIDHGHFGDPAAGEIVAGCIAAVIETP